MWKFTRFYAFFTVGPLKIKFHRCRKSQIFWANLTRHSRSPTKSSKVRSKWNTLSIFFISNFKKRLWGVSSSYQCFFAPSRCHKTCFKFKVNPIYQKWTSNFQINKTDHINHFFSWTLPSSGPHRHFTILVYRSSRRKQKLLCIIKVSLLDCKIFQFTRFTSIYI